MGDTSAKTVETFWDKTLDAPPRMRLPSTLPFPVRERVNLLKREIKPGMKLLEIGCAPGKFLAYAAKVLGAEVSGLDYSEPGIRWSKQLFEVLGLKADLRCEDVFATSFAPAIFDVVHSAGLIEHFDDPTEIVRIHVNLVKPGGVALITIPNFGGIYGKFGAITDLELMRMHNLNIMNPDALLRLAPKDMTAEVRSYPAGRFSFTNINFHKKLPRPLAHAASIFGNLIGYAQPVKIPALCTQLVLRIVRG